MNRTLLLVYQFLTGLSDTLTGALLIVAPGFTLMLMGVDAAVSQFVFVSYIGAFVFAVGLCCLYGGRLVLRGDRHGQLGTVWLLTALVRASVAIFVAAQVLGGALPAGWIPVAAFDGACVLIQAIGLQKGWTSHAAL